MATFSNSTFRFGKTCTSSRCCILILSNDDMIVKELISHMLTNNSELYGNRFQVNAFLPLSSTMRSDGIINGDYIVIVVNPCRNNWTEEVDIIIGMINKANRFSRFCLVVDVSSSLGSSILNVRYCLDIIKKKYSVPLLFGEFDREEVMSHLSQRLLCFIEKVCCNSFGLPIPTVLPDLD